MAGRKRNWIVLLCAAVMALATGCFMRSPDELFALPQQAEDYYNLQQAINTAMQDAAYCAPVGGDNRQSVQMKDLNGDGVNEAIVFAKAEGNLPLKIYVFGRDGTVFSQIACLEGDGAVFDTVQFAQIDGREGLEMVVTRQLTEGVPQMVSVYASVDGTVTEVFSGSFRQIRLLDMDADQRDELFVLRDDPARQQAVAALYQWQNGQLLAVGSADASGSAETFLHLQVGKTTDGAAALFLTQSVEETQAITDVFVWVDNVFYNASSRNPETPPTPHPASLLPADIDGNGATELPRMAVSADTAHNETDYFLAEWYSLSSDGTEGPATLTCHHADGAWYVILDSAWQQTLSVRCQGTDDYHLTTFTQAQPEEEAEQMLFAICAYYGADGETWAADNGYFVLDSKAGVSYCAQLGPSAGFSQQTLKERFCMRRESAE